MKRALPVLAFVLGLLVLVPVVALFTTQGPFERTPPGAQDTYWQDALAVHSDAGSQVTKAEPAPAPPRPPSPYALLLSPLASGDLGSVHRARAVQAAIFLLIAAVAAFLLARPRVGPWAVAAGLVPVLFAPLAISAHNLSPALPGAALLLAALVVLDRGSGWAAWAVAGALTGAAAGFFPLLAWPMAALFLVRAVTAGTAPRRGLATGSFLAAGAAALIAFSALSETRIPVISGVDVYRGHRAAASGVSPRRGETDIRAWWTFADYGREAARVKNRALTPAQANRYWLGKALGESASHPLAELRRIGIKALAAYQGDPLPHEVGAAFLRERTGSRMLDVLVWAGRILIPLGLWGLLWRRKQAGWVLGAAALSGLVAFLITFANPMARLITLVACGAGVGLWLASMVRGPSRVTGAVGALVALGLWGVLPVHGGVPGLGIHGDDSFYLGTIYDREKRGSAAMREYERALRLDPAGPLPHLAIAAMLARDNVNEEATRELEELRARYPDYPPALFALARLYQAQERWSDAANVYGDLMRIEPWNPEHLNNLGTVYVKMGFFDQAVRAMQSALRIDPNYRAARDNLQKLRASGILTSEEASTSSTKPYERSQRDILGLIKAGNFPAAQESLKAAYTTFGKDRWELRFLEGTLAVVSGDAGRAVAIFEPLRKQTPNNVFLLVNLAAAYEKLGRLEEAKGCYEAARKLQPANERVRRGLEAVTATLDSLKNKPR